MHQSSVSIRSSGTAARATSRAVAHLRHDAGGGRSADHVVQPDHVGHVGERGMRRVGDHQRVAAWPPSPPRRRRRAARAGGRSPSRRRACDERASARRAGGEVDLEPVGVEPVRAEQRRQHAAPAARASRDWSGRRATGTPSGLRMQSSGGEPLRVPRLPPEQDVLAAPVPRPRSSPSGRATSRGPARSCRRPSATCRRARPCRATRPCASSCVEEARRSWPASRGPSRCRPPSRARWNWAPQPQKIGSVHQAGCSRSATGGAASRATRSSR